MKTNINLRPSSLKKFWGKEFDSSLFLWYGAMRKTKHIDNHIKKIDIMDDIFSSSFEVDIAVKNCKTIYFNYLPILANRLNAIHNVNFSEKFWETAFGFWLFRHICIVYEKFEYLSKIDIDNCSAKLLSRKDFYVPEEQYDYLHCFCNDFGVQQLFSQYYYLFSKKSHPVLRQKFTLSEDKNIPVIDKTNFAQKVKGFFLKNIFQIIRFFRAPKLVLVEILYPRNLLLKLFFKSKFYIQTLELPKVDVSKLAIDYNRRLKLSNVECTNDFNRYLNATLFHCFPKIFLEYFNKYNSKYSEDILKLNFKYIASSAWIGMSKVSLYYALAKNYNKVLLNQEHATGTQIICHTTTWLNLEIDSLYMTSGWSSKLSKIITGGFIYENKEKYNFDSKKNNILFIGHTRYPFLMEFSSHASNSNFFKEIDSVKIFYDLLDENLKNKFLFRPRKAKHLFDTEKYLNFKKENISTGNFLENILDSKIVVIDHISTGLGHLVSTQAPFILIMHSYSELREEYIDFFRDLEKFGVVHYSARSASFFINKIYPDIKKWWFEEKLQKTLTAFGNSFIGSKSNNTDFLLSIIKK